MMKITEITGGMIPGSVSGIPDHGNVIPEQKTSPEPDRNHSQENSGNTVSLRRPERVGYQNAGPEDFSLTFNKEESFDYIGREKDPAKLDVEKAVSDMRRDSVLQEYQYFVGGKPDLEYDGDIDGRFFIKE